jgi:hypothetical protein
MALGAEMKQQQISQVRETGLRLGTVIYWSALRKMGIQDKIKGFGRFLEHH